MRLVKETIKDLRDFYTTQRVKGKSKVFCIGLNKTGTTSLEKAFRDLGYTVGDQKRAERLLASYRDKNFEPIISFCQTAQIFQDFPFSYPDTFKYLDKAFPNSKFVLSVRDSPEQWCDSITKFHSKMFGGGKVPTVTDLKNATYVQKGWAWESFRLLFGIGEQDDPYDKARIVAAYDSYNQSVADYFKDRSDLLVINLSDKDAYSKFCAFLGIQDSHGTFPWENRTEEVITRK